MRYHDLPGFSIAELLVSIAIVGLLATFAVVSLDSSKNTEELRTVARQVVGDIRSMQARALSAQNIKTCATSAGYDAVCENGIASCVGPCALATPAGFGIHFEATSSTYVMFADVIADAQYRYTDTKENLVLRRIAETTSNVVIQQVTVPASVANGDIMFLRQSATPHVYHPGMPVDPEPVSFIIRLKHKISEDTVDVEVDRITGRISVL